MARPIAKDHSEKRAHILRIAARVFADGGIARASMAQVAEACGISKANIYHYYDSQWNQSASDHTKPMLVQSFAFIEYSISNPRLFSSEDVSHFSSIPLLVY